MFRSGVRVVSRPRLAGQRPRRNVILVLQLHGPRTAAGRQQPGGAACGSRSGATVAPAAWRRQVRRPYGAKRIAAAQVAPARLRFASRSSRTALLAAAGAAPRRHRQPEGARCGGHTAPSLAAAQVAPELVAAEAAPIREQPVGARCGGRTAPIAAAWVAPLAVCLSVHLTGRSPALLVGDTGVDWEAGLVRGRGGAREIGRFRYRAQPGAQRAAATRRTCPPCKCAVLHAGTCACAIALTMTAPTWTSDEVQRLLGDLPAGAFGVGPLNSLDWVRFVLDTDVDPRSSFSAQGGASTARAVRRSTGRPLLWYAGVARLLAEEMGSVLPIDFADPSTGEWIKTKARANVDGPRAFSVVAGRAGGRGRQAFQR